MEHLRERSHAALRRLVPGSAFDLVYVDGWHTELGAWVDVVLSLARLRPGGVLIVDDWQHPFMARLAPALRTLFAEGIFAETARTLHIRVSRQ